MHEVVCDSYFIHSQLIESVEIIKEKERIVLDGALSKLHSEPDTLELTNTKGDYIRIKNTDSSVSIHLLQRQLLFHLLNTGASRMKLEIDLTNKWFVFRYKYSTLCFDGILEPEPYHFLRYNILNVELPIIRERIAKRIINIFEDNRAYQIPIINDVLISLIYYDPYKDVFTCPCEIISLIDTTDTKSIQLQNDNEKFKILVQYFDVFENKDRIINLIPYGTEGYLDIKEIFQTIICILFNSNDYSPLVDNAAHISISMEGDIVQINGLDYNMFRLNTKKTDMKTKI